MLISKIFETFTTETRPRNPTSLQESNYANQYIGKQIKLCGEVYDVKKNSQITLVQQVTGYHNQYVYHKYIGKLKAYIFIDFQNPNEDILDSQIDKGDLFEVFGRIVRIVKPERNLPYPQLQYDHEDDQHVIVFDFKLDATRFDPIEKLWIDRNTFEL